MPKTRNVKLPLTPERIVDAALALVHQDGLAGLSTRRLGQRLGCEAMSIYHHYPNKQHLLDALVDHAIASVEMPSTDLTPVERLRASMYSYRAMAHRFPALFPLVAVHRLNTPTGVRFIESILALIQAVVPDTELAARHFRAIGYYLTGSALDETSGYAKGPSAAEPVSDEFIVRECPRLVAAARFFKAGEWDTTFALGLETLLARIVADGASTATP
ncbi:MAG TPA: TetR family transcriptional regulator [Albitalea sp.]|nr:TetR family transcriptional regulator [Albitalea sp.]